MLVGLTVYMFKFSAVFGNGKMLARLPNFTFNTPSELKERHKKKYGQTIPLVAFTKSDR